MTAAREPKESSTKHGGPYEVNVSDIPVPHPNPETSQIRNGSARLQTPQHRSCHGHL